MKIILSTLLALMLLGCDSIVDIDGMHRNVVTENGLGRLFEKQLNDLGIDMVHGECYFNITEVRQQSTGHVKIRYRDAFGTTSFMLGTECKKTGNLFDMRLYYPRGGGPYFGLFTAESYSEDILIPFIQSAIVDQQARKSKSL